MSPGPREDPCLRFHMCESFTRCISPHLCLSILSCWPPARSVPHDTLPYPLRRIICKIHVSRASINTRPKLSYRCLSIHVLGSIYKHPYLRGLCKIHLSGYITRSVAQCLQIHVSAPADLICKIHVSGVHTCDPARRSLCPDACLGVHLWIRYQKEANRHCAFDTEDTSRGMHLLNMKSAPRHNETPKIGAQPHLDVSSQYEVGKKKFPTTPGCQLPKTICETDLAEQPHRAGETQILTSGDAFLWPCEGRTLRPFRAPAANLKQTSPLPLP